jgi:hypothetical protein
MNANDPKQNLVNQTGSHSLHDLTQIVSTALAPFSPAAAVVSAIQTLLGKAGTEFEKRKILTLMQHLQTELAGVKTDRAQIKEDLYEVFVNASEGVHRTPSGAKIKRFARIISGHITGTTDWDGTSVALRLVDRMDDIHIRILNEAWLHAPVIASDSQVKVCFYINDPGSYVVNSADDGKISFSNTKSDLKACDILEYLEGWKAREITLFCIEMMALGLLHDNDQGTFDKGPVFSFTEAGVWLLPKIENIDSERMHNPSE